MNKFTNIHSHIFTAKHSPDFFLETAISAGWMPTWLRNALARRVHDIVQRKNTRLILTALNSLLKMTSPDKRSTLRRYIEFVKIGTSSTQKEIFDDMAKAYAHMDGYNIVVLTQVLDYLDIEQKSAHIRIQTQVDQIADLKRNALYQQNIHPFLGIDPRMAGVDLLNDWLKKYINKDYGFCGIKIYPAAGFFPFDIRLDPVWEWAEENQVPIITHCTRGGSWYLGRFASVFNPGAFNEPGLNPGSKNMPAIQKRIQDLKRDKNAQKKNSLWCNIFGHPQNYRPVLEKYPDLKICLAHAGGANEILRDRGKYRPKPAYPDYFDDNWYTEVKELMRDFTNVYTDISYTLSNPKALHYAHEDFVREPDIFNKVMYGTDFYLTQQEKAGDEPGLQDIFFSEFTPGEIQMIAYDTPGKFMKNKICGG